MYVSWVHWTSCYWHVLSILLKFKLEVDEQRLVGYYSKQCVSTLLTDTLTLIFYRCQLWSVLIIHTKLRKHARSQFRSAADAVVGRAKSTKFAQPGQCKSRWRKNELRKNLEWLKWLLLASKWKGTCCTLQPRCVKSHLLFVLNLLLLCINNYVEKIVNLNSRLL